MPNNFKNYDMKKTKSFANKIKERSRTWGQVKFTPAPVVEEEPTPWKHVKNDILDDEEEERNAKRFNLESQEAKDVMKQRKLNHMRNIIEAKRTEKVKWETFDDGSSSTPSAPSAPAKSWIDPKNMGFKERNYIRAKLTRSVMQKKSTGNLATAINDLQRIQSLKGDKKKGKICKNKTK